MNLGERSTQAGMVAVKIFIIALVVGLVPVLASPDFAAALDSLLGPVWTPVALSFATAALAALAKAIGGVTQQVHTAIEAVPGTRTRRAHKRKVEVADRPNLLAV